MAWHPWRMALDAAHCQSVGQSATTRQRQLLGINLACGASTPAFMGQHVRMHAQRDAGHLGSGSAETHAAQHLYPRVTSFRSRRSTLNDAQQETWDRLWPRLGTQARPQAGIDPDPTPAQPCDTSSWFGRKAPIVLEIGCGTGTSTLAMAQAEPDIDVVAVEVYRRGLAQLLSAIDRADVANIRLVRGDGLDVLERMFAPASLTGVRVFFPDPWPKSRHHKRRLLQQQTVALIGERLRPGGVLHAATDHAGYARQIAETGDAEPQLRRAEPGEDLPISVQRPITKYETKAQQAGSPVTELLWVRKQ